MITHEDMLEHKARQLLSDVEIAKMEHCIGWNKHKVYHRWGKAYFAPYRNHFDPGGTDVKIWAGLYDKGLADRREYKDGEYMYWVNRCGFAALSDIERCFIYSDAASGNMIDATPDVIEVLLDDAVYCGYGCWIPSGSENIAKRARLPQKLTIETLKYLKKKGYAKHVYEGGIDDEGYPHCTHGWILSKKWIDEHKERYEARQQEEYKRMDEIEKKVRQEMAAEGRS